MNMEIQAALDVADETDSFLQITDVIYDKESEVGFDSLNEAEQTVFCMDNLLREMENGGFAQFFHHDSGQYWQQTLEALERIKSKHVHGIFQQVLDLFEGNVPEDIDERVDAFDQIESENPDRIAELDDRFYDEDENLVAITLKFVSKEIKSF